MSVETMDPKTSMTLTKPIMAAALSLLLAGCSVTAGLKPVDVAVSAGWQSPLPHSGRMTELAGWWSTFRDPALTRLVHLAEGESPTLASAVASIASARATLDAASASVFPSVAASSSAERSGNAGDGSNAVAGTTTKTGALDASWEVDLFGKAGSTAGAAAARLDAARQDWNDARVSLAAEMADEYVQYRACRQLEATYRDSLASQKATIAASEKANQSGLSSSSDLALVRANAATSSATLTAQAASCELLVKSMTALAGGDEPAVRAALGKGTAILPQPATLKVVSVPADTVRQRPDLRALERELAAAMYDADAAAADRYPSLSLSGSITISQSGLTGTSAPWSFGPALSVPLFDAGSRKAALSGKIAAYDGAAAAYRAGVVTAVSEVETALVQVDSIRRQIGDAASAAKNYQTYFAAVDANWKAGGVSILDREDARRSAQNSRISLIELRRDVLRQYIALYKALGGGFLSGPADPSKSGS